MVLEGPLDERAVGTIFSLPSGMARACQFVSLFSEADGDGQVILMEVMGMGM